MNILLKALLVTAALIASGIWRAYVITKLWQWFIVVTFHTESINLAQAYVLSMLATLLTYVHYPVAKDTDVKQYLINSLVGHFLMSGTSLLVGYILHHFS